MSIKYYQLAKDEELPDEFCAVSVDGEPSEYTFYVPETENAKLRELVRHLYECTRHNVCVLCDYADDACDFEYDMRELGVDA